MMGVVFKVKSEMKNDVIETLKNFCNSKLVHPYGYINRDNRKIPLNLNFLEHWQELDDGYSTNFYFDIKVQLLQYSEGDIFTEEWKKANKVRFYYIDNDCVNNYILVLANKSISNNLIKVLNKLLFQKIGKNKAPIMYVDFFISNQKIDELKKRKVMSALNQMYVDETDDTYVKSQKITGKKDKDLCATENYKQMGEISNRYKTIKIGSPKFNQKVTINEKGYFSSIMPEEKFKTLVTYFLKEFQEVKIIDDSNYAEILVTD